MKKAWRTFQKTEYTHPSTHLPEVSANDSSGNTKLLGRKQKEAPEKTTGVGWRMLSGERSSC